LALRRPKLSIVRSNLWLRCLAVAGRSVHNPIVKREYAVFRVNMRHKHTCVGESHREHCGELRRAEAGGRRTCGVQVVDPTRAPEALARPLCREARAVKPAQHS
jgi:hypothetical protein